VLAGLCFILGESPAVRALERRCVSCTQRTNDEGSSGCEKKPGSSKPGPSQRHYAEQSNDECQNLEQTALYRMYGMNDFLYVFPEPQGAHLLTSAALSNGTLPALPGQSYPQVPICPQDRYSRIRTSPTPPHFGLDLGLWAE
jgi:hypothetical protein